MKYLYLFTCLVQLFIFIRFCFNDPTKRKLSSNETEYELRETRICQQAFSDLRIYAQYYTEMKRREKLTDKDKLDEKLSPMWLEVFKYKYIIWDLESAQYAKENMYMILKEEYESGRPLYSW